MANYFYIALKDSPRSWFMNLAPKSIRTGKGLCREFLINFQGTSKRPRTQVHLDRVVQPRDEMLRQFMRRFSLVRNTVPRIEPAQVISAFCHGVRDKDILGELSVHQPETVTQLFQLADTCALHDEAQAWYDPLTKQGTDSGTEPINYRKKKLLKKRKAEEVLATGSPATKRGRPGQSSAPKPEAFKPLP